MNQTDFFYEFDEDRSSRSKRRRIRVTFPDGTVYCYANVTTTFVETLKRIGIDRLKDVSLEVGHLPMITDTEYPQYKGYMKPLADGWFVNTQGDTTEKHHRLASINQQLGLDLKIEIGEDIVPTSERPVQARTVSQNITVTLKDGTVLEGKDPKEVFIQAVEANNPMIIKAKELMVKNKEIVTRFQKYPNQVPISDDLWLTVPGTTQEKTAVLEMLNKKLGWGISVTYV
jgi:hypothetical protein